MQKIKQFIKSYGLYIISMMILLELLIRANI